MIEPGEIKKYSFAIVAIFSRSIVLKPGHLEEIETSVWENAQSGYTTKGGLTWDKARAGHAF